MRAKGGDREGTGACELQMPRLSAKQMAARKRAAAALEAARRSRLAKRRCLEAAAGPAAAAEQEGMQGKSEQCRVNERVAELTATLDALHKTVQATRTSRLANMKRSTPGPRLA